jgi:hypothetical protein
VNVVKMVSLAVLVFRDHQAHVGCQVKVLWEEKVYQVLLAQQDLQDHRYRTHSCGCEQSLVHKHFTVIKDKCIILFSLININPADRI